LADIDVSVIVPAYRGAATIADCLESIGRATAGRRCEIIVVESSGDAAAQIICGRFPGVKLIQSPQRLTAGAARNRGVAEASGRLIFFTDQDCLVPADWILRLEQHMADPAIGAAGGAVGIRDRSNRSGAAVYFLEFLRHFPNSGPAQTNANFLVGCNSVYRAAALKAVRFPDQTLGEDVLFSYALRVNGFGVVYDPSVAVLHTNRQGWDEFFAYNRKMGAAAADYHDLLRLWWIGPFFRAPLLAFVAPLVILPSIGLSLWRSSWSYLWQFVTLSPMCLAGNLVWAAAFRRRVLELRQRPRTQESIPS